MRVLAASMLAGAAAAKFFDKINDALNFEIETDMSYSEFQESSPGEQMVVCSSFLA